MSFGLDFLMILRLKRRPVLAFSLPRSSPLINLADQKEMTFSIAQQGELTFRIFRIRFTLHPISYTRRWQVVIVATLTDETKTAREKTILTA